MNHSNNYFQKGVIILVATMLLTIQSLRVYSFVGSYQLSSQGVDANNYYNIHTKKKDFFNMPAIIVVTAVIGIIAASAAVSLAVTELHLQQHLQGHMDETDNYGIINPALEHNSLNEKYVKHDFSEFDN